MEFEILSPKKKESVKEGFYIKLKLMFGDADFYDVLTMGTFSKDQTNYLEEVVTLLDKLKQTSDSDNYDNVDEFKVWFTEDSGIKKDDPRYNFVMNDVNFKRASKDFCYSWPSHEGTNYSLEYYTVFYLDSNGVEYDVKVTK